MSIHTPPPATGTPLAGIRGLATALTGWRGLFVFVVVLNVVAVSSQVVGTAAGAWAVSIAILGGATHELLAPTVIVASAVILRGVSSWLESWLSHDLSFRMMSRVRAWIVDAIGRVAPAGIAHRRRGDLATTTMNDSESLEIFYAHSSVYIASAWLTTPLLWSGVALVDLPTAVTLLPVLAIAAAIPLSVRHVARRNGAEIRGLLAELGSEMQENVGAVREITGYGLVEERIERIERIQESLSRVQRANARRAGCESAAAGGVSVVGTLVAASMGAVQIAEGALDALYLAPLIALAGGSSAAIVQWIGVTKHYGTTRSAAQRIESVLYAPAPVDRSGIESAPVAEPTGVTASSIGFSWPGESAEPSPRALDDVSIVIEPGSTVAIAGRSGAGKSTFAWLAARLIDPDAGTFTVDGVRLDQIRSEELTDVVSLVPQEVHLFNDTVRDNLVLAGQDDAIDDEELWAALRAALADDLVRSLPLGLDSMLGERGMTLSGGERQRLALTRSILHSSRILILDEAVSQLDIASEAEVRDALRHARLDRTTIIIAHRLSTLLAADRIIMLERGRAIGDGDHGELMRGCAPYRHLVAPQLAALGRGAGAQPGA